MTQPNSTARNIVTEGMEALLLVRELVESADRVIALAKSADESAATDAAFVAAVVRLREAAKAARPLIAPPGPPSAPRGDWTEAMRA